MNLPHSAFGFVTAAISRSDQIGTRLQTTTMNRCCEAELGEAELSLSKTNLTPHRRVGDDSLVWNLIAILCYTAILTVTRSAEANSRPFAPRPDKGLL
jgi:hypothetical protein